MRGSPHRPAARAPIAAPAPSPPRNATSTTVSACSELPRLCPRVRAQATSWTRPAHPERANTAARRARLRGLLTARGVLWSGAPAAAPSAAVAEAGDGPAALALGEDEGDLPQLAVQRGGEARREGVGGAGQRIGAQLAYFAVALG